MLELPLNATSEAMIWQVAKEIVEVPQPLTLTHPKEKLVATARQGRMNLADKVVQLNQDVVVVGERNQTRLTANTLDWTVDDQTVVAAGQVNYQQVNPDLNLSGARAVGRLNDQTILVNGGPVITKIVPD
ncbi:MAG: LPS export ABC transporter periplasmic protein LptC [Leptolyngbyaceae cyanobacterium SM2_3_12]|nr:LPS export ABC transporter periplasmic protein LptC [Leptolyngbyaceae cyanobacterium SM2_3_12]